MKTEWNYTDLADAYLKRPEYSDDAISEMVETCQIESNARVCDIGAGCAHLTLKLLERGYAVSAVEPNEAMRAHGIRRTKSFEKVRWFEGTGEMTGQNDNRFHLVTFGSSFNVTDRASALKETARILKPGGWFACMWNHRVLEDPIQSELEGIIGRQITDYNYGKRREDQTEIIEASGLFRQARYIEGTVKHTQTIDDCIEAWRSHGTLHRQAGDKFNPIIEEMGEYLRSLNQPSIEVPYVTRLWCCELRS